MKHAIRTLALAAASLGIAHAHAQDYQAELGASYSDRSSDTAASEDSALALDFTYYLDRVSTRGRPLAEAAFLSHANNLGALYLTTDESEIDAWALQGEFYPGQFYLRGLYSGVSRDLGATDVDADRWEARAGLMLADNLRLAAGVDRSEIDAPGFDASTDTVLEAKYVTPMANGTALNLQGDLTFFDEDASGEDVTGLDLAGDYYFTPMASLGLRYQRLDADTAESDDFGVAGTLFFTPLFSGTLAYNSAADGDDDVITARLGARF